MTTPSLPDLRLPAVRARLTQGLPPVIRMLEAWGLSRAEQGELLTLNPRTVRRALKGDGLPRLNRDQLMRLSLIAGIYRALHLLYDHTPADRWLKHPNQRAPFSGRSPLEYLLQGDIPALLATRRLLNADRSGHFSATPKARALAATLPQPEIQLEG